MNLAMRRDWWNERAARCATDPDRIDQSLRSQRARFSTVDSLIFPGCSILDVGCGVGDLFGYLSDKGIACSYMGVDLAPLMIKRAREKYPDGHFEEANILQWEPSQRFDLVVGISIHSDPIPDAETVLQRVLAQQFALARVAAHVSLLSSQYDSFGPDALYWSPSEVLSMALKITPWVSLRHDYLPHDFSVTLRRDHL